MFHFHYFCDLVYRILLQAWTKGSRGSEGVTEAESLASDVEIAEAPKNQFASKVNSCEKVSEMHTRSSMRSIYSISCSQHPLLILPYLPLQITAQV